MSAPATLANLSAVKLALMAQEVRAQTSQVLRADPIAIVGMACRTPGGCETPDAFWQLLATGVDATSEDEQPVSSVRLGPRKSKKCEIRLATTPCTEPVRVRVSKSFGFRNTRRA